MNVGDKVIEDIDVEGSVDIVKIEEVSVTVAVYESYSDDGVGFAYIDTVLLRGNCGEEYSFVPYNVLDDLGIITPVTDGTPGFHLKEDGLFILNGQDEIRYASHPTHTIDQEISTPDPLYQDTTIILRYSMVYH